jgi:hypothetical protein
MNCRLCELVIVLQLLVVTSRVNKCSIHVITNFKWGLKDALCLCKELLNTFQSGALHVRRWISDIGWIKNGVQQDATK